MWIRKCYLDDQSDIQSPIPNCISSNEEFIPPPQSAKEREVENRLRVMADKNAKKLGLSRRGFLQTSCGMAAAMICFNEVFGKTYEVDAAEVLDPAASTEKWPKTEFIFDNQTHHIDVETGWFEKTQAGREAADFLRRFRPNEKTTTASLEALNEAHYIKELYFDSDTMMSIISGVPSSAYSGPNADNILPPDKMVKTRNEVNGWAHSQRMLSHGLLRPNFGPAEFEEMHRQKEVLKIDSWKMYPGAEIAKGGWWLDDEKTAYPFWERSRKIGIKNHCVHKGLPLGLFNETYCNPRDVEKVAKDFPDLNFIIYHSAIKHGPNEPDFKDASNYDPTTGDFAWHNILMDIKRRNPKMTNVYPEIGSFFGVLAIADPVMCMHGMGKNIKYYGADHVIWGTDCLWWGSPQWVIDAFKRFQISDDLCERFGYKKISKEDKAKIFGLNAARLYALNVNEKRNALPGDALDKLKSAYLDNGGTRSNAAYGWVRADD